MTASIRLRTFGLTLLTSVVIAAGPAALAVTTPSTTLEVPNLIQAGIATTLVAEVSQPSGQGSPEGTVTFRTGYGATLGTAAVTSVAPGTSRATLSWTPPPEYSVPLMASFTPTGGTAPISSSPYSRPLITSAPVPVALRFAQELTAGRVTIDAVLGDGFGPGSVSFLVDGRGWTGSVPTVNGVASVVWDATPGVHTIVAQYSNSVSNSAGFAIQSGSSTQVVNVLP